MEINPFTLAIQLDPQSGLLTTNMPPSAVMACGLLRMLQEAVEEKFVRGKFDALVKVAPPGSVVPPGHD